MGKNGNEVGLSIYYCLDYARAVAHTRHNKLSMQGRVQIIRAREEACAGEFISDLVSSLSQRVHLTTDGLRVDAAGEARGKEPLDARRAPAIIFAEHQPLHGAGMGDHARPGDRGRHIGGPTDDRALAEDRAQHLVLLHAVLE